MVSGRDPTPPPFAIRHLTWFAVDRIELAEPLRLAADTREHAAAAAALEAWLLAHRRAPDVETVMRGEGRYKVLSEAEMRADRPLWLEAQWEVLLFETAADRQVYRAPWNAADWDRLAADLSRAIGLPFWRDAARRGLFGFRCTEARLGFLTLREVRETLKAWGHIDPTRFRGTSLRLALTEELQESLRAVSQHDHELILSLV